MTESAPDNTAAWASDLTKTHLALMQASPTPQPAGHWISVGAIKEAVRVMLTLAVELVPLVVFEVLPVGKGTVPLIVAVAEVETVEETIIEPWARTERIKVKIHRFI